jgi:hypothetical protein
MIKIALIVGIALVMVLFMVVGVYVFGLGRLFDVGDHERWCKECGSRQVYVFDYVEGRMMWVDVTPGLEEGCICHEFADDVDECFDD